MRNGAATRAALQTIRNFSAAPATARLHSHRNSPWSAIAPTDGRWMRHEQACRRGPLGLRFATCKSDSEITLDAVPPSTEISEGHVVAVQDRASECKAVAERNCALEIRVNDMCAETGKKPVGLGIDCISSAVEIPEELHEKLSHLVKLVEQQSRSLTLLSGQFEEQKQCLNTILDRLEHLKMNARCKIQCPSPAPPPFPSDQVTLDNANVSTSGSRNLSAHPWPEWNCFLDHLRSLPFFKEFMRAAPGWAGSPLPDESISIKRMLAKFSQTHEYLFDALSRKQLQILADYGCPNDDRRTVASYKRLQDYFQMDKTRVSRGAVSSDFGLEKPKLADIMRQIYMIIELAGQKGASNNVKLSILHILEEITALTASRECGNPAYLEKFSKSRAGSQNLLTKKNREAELRVEDINCPSEAKSSSGSENWECPRCSHFNNIVQNACQACNLQRQENIDQTLNNLIPNSNFPSSNRSRLEAGVLAKEDGRICVSASRTHLEDQNLDKGSQNLAEGFLEDNRLLSIGEELQACTLSEKDEKGVQGVRSNNNGEAKDHPDIFNDMFSQNSTSSLRKVPKCTLSELLRQNKEEFSLTKKETETDDLRKKGMRPSERQRDYDSTNINQRVVHGNTSLESENMSLRQSKGNQWHSRPDLSLGLKWNSLNSSGGRVGNASACQSKNDERQSSTMAMCQYDTDDDLSATFETPSSVSSKLYGSKLSKSNQRKYRDDIDELESSFRRGFERRKRKEGSRSW